MIKFQELEIVYLTGKVTKRFHNIFWLAEKPELLNDLTNVRESEINSVPEHSSIKRCIIFT